VDEAYPLVARLGCRPLRPSGPCCRTNGEQTPGSTEHSAVPFALGVLLEDVRYAFGQSYTFLGGFLVKWSIADIVGPGVDVL
jgi:hypothetical protein